MLRKAAQGWNYRNWNRERREAELREKEEHERSIEEWQAQVESQGFECHPCVPCGPPPKETSSMRVLPNVHEALRQNDPSRAPGSHPVLKKVPPSTGRPRPKAFYSASEPPRIGTAPVQPPPPPKPSTWDGQLQRNAQQMSSSSPAVDSQERISGRGRYRTIWSSTDIDWTRSLEEQLEPNLKGGPDPSKSFEDLCLLRKQIPRLSNSHFNQIYPSDNVVRVVQKSHGVHDVKMSEVAAWVLNATHWFSLLKQPMMIVIWC